MQSAPNFLQLWNNCVVYNNSLCVFHLKTKLDLKTLPYRIQTMTNAQINRDMIISQRRKKKKTQFPDRATIPVSRVKMRIHAEQPVFSSGGRSRFRLNYMRSPAVNHTSPRQPAFTPSPRQHQWGPIPSTGDRRAQKTTVSLYSLFDIQCMRSSVVFRHMSLRGKRAMDRCGMSTHLSICVG